MLMALVCIYTAGAQGQVETKKDCKPDTSYMVKVIPSSPPTHILFREITADCLQDKGDSEDTMKLSDGQSVKGTKRYSMRITISSPIAIMPEELNNLSYTRFPDLIRGEKLYVGYARISNGFQPFFKPVYQKSYRLDIGSGKITKYETFSLGLTILCHFFMMVALLALIGTRVGFFHYKVRRTKEASVILVILYFGLMVTCIYVVNILTVDEGIPPSGWTWLNIPNLIFLILFSFWGMKIQRKMVKNTESKKPNNLITELW